MEEYIIQVDKNQIKKDMKNILKQKEQFCKNIRSPQGEKYDEKHFNLDRIDRVYKYNPATFCLVARLKNPGGHPIYMRFHSSSKYDYTIFMTQNQKLFRVFFEDEDDDQLDYAPDHYDPHTAEDLFLSVYHNFLKKRHIPSELWEYWEVFEKAKFDYDGYRNFDLPQSPYDVVPYNVDWVVPSSNDKPKNVIKVESHHSFAITL